MFCGSRNSASTCASTSAKSAPKVLELARGECVQHGNYRKNVYLKRSACKVLANLSRAHFLTHTLPAREQTSTSANVTPDAERGAA
jgi:hypothetical protein